MTYRATSPKGAVDPRTLEDCGYGEFKYQRKDGTDYWEFETEKGRAKFIKDFSKSRGAQEYGGDWPVVSMVGHKWPVVQSKPLVPPTYSPSTDDLNPDLGWREQFMDWI